jgi:hypothetical protein
VSDEPSTPRDDWGFPPVVPAAPASPPVAAAQTAVIPEASAEPPSAGVLPVPRRPAVAAAPVSPLRAVAGAAVAVAGVLLGIGALLWATDAPTSAPALQQTQAQSSQQSASPSATPEQVTVTPAPLQTRAVRPAPKLPLTVLNNSTVTRLAAKAAERYVSAGWPVRLVGSFRGRVSVTTVYFSPGQQASALALKKAFPGIERVRPRFAGLPGSGLTVVLTRTYQV